MLQRRAWTHKALERVGLFSPIRALQQGSYSDNQSTRLLNWLSNVGPGVHPDIRNTMLGYLLKSPSAVLIVAFNSLMVNLVGMLTQHHPVFILFMIVDIGLGLTRFMTIHATLRNRTQHLSTTIDSVTALALTWCILQGVMTFTIMMMNDPTLQILATVITLGLVGPVCARYYPAPRLGLAVVCILQLPFMAGAALSGNVWLFVLVLMTFPYLYGVNQVIRNLHAITVKMLTAERASERQARQDPLTGLMNRLGYTEAIAGAIRTPNLTVVLFCLDLDGFKQVNDTLGHQAGDSLLRGVARRLEESVRHSDIVIRLGGDEFAIIAREMEQDLAGTFADRLIDRVSTEPYVLAPANSIHIGVSIGFACAPHDGVDEFVLHARADAALYASKAAGKGVARRFAEAA